MRASRPTRAAGSARGTGAASLPAGRPRHSDVVEDAIVVAPRRVDLDAKVEKHRRPEELLEIDSRFGSDPLDHLAGAPDHNRLLRFRLHEGRAVKPEDALALLFVEFIDD